MNGHPAIRAGLIGFGYVGRTFHAPLIAATEGIALVAVASSQAEAVRAAVGDVATFADPIALIAHDAVDLVIVASPNDSHAPLALAALAAGKHVVVEKPFTLTLDEARAVASAAERADRVLAVFHNRRWDSDFLTVRAAIAAGAIGRVVHFESHFDRFRPAVRDRWRERAVPGAGIWYDLAPHLIDQALLLFGLPDAVEANLAALRDRAATDDWAHAVLHYPHARVILHASMLAAGGSPRFLIHGDAGSMVKHAPDQQEAQLLAGLPPGAAGWGDDHDALHSWDGAGEQRHVAATPGDQRAFYRGIVAAIRGAAANPVPPIQALAVMAVLEAGLRASAERRAIVPALSAAERAAWRESLA